MIHRTIHGLADFMVVLTFDFYEERGPWVGVCLELGTSAFSDSLEQVREELRDAVELQLNEMERLCDVRDYLEENHVHAVPIEAATSPEEAGFVVGATGV